MANLKFTNLQVTQKFEESLIGSKYKDNNIRENVLIGFLFT